MSVIEPSTGDQAHRLISDNDALVLDFYASWCMPCKKLRPGLEQLAAEQKGKAVVVALDIDNPSFQAIVENFQVTSLPLLIVVRGNVNVLRLEGYDPEYVGKLRRALQ